MFNKYYQHYWIWTGFEPDICLRIGFSCLEKVVGQKFRSCLLAFSPATQLIAKCRTVPKSWKNTAIIHKENSKVMFVCKKRIHLVNWISFLHRKNRYVGAFSNMYALTFGSSREKNVDYKEHIVGFEFSGHKAPRKR